MAYKPFVAFMSLNIRMVTFEQHLYIILDNYIIFARNIIAIEFDLPCLGHIRHWPASAWPCLKRMNQARLIALSNDINGLLFSVIRVMRL